jgi:omega-6 fatty acid desaturase (delta-12 desaturase)
VKRIRSWSTYYNEATTSSMGKGGQRAVAPKSATSSTGSATLSQSKEQVWTSSYNPLAKDAPELPTKGQIKAVIPKECFQRSAFWSTFYLMRDLAMAAAFCYGTSQVLSTDLPQDATLILPWALGWGVYAFWMGTILTGPWVVAHECGHGAYSDSQTFNDVVGFIVHQALLVPYFAWQYTHAKHHRRTNHLVDGESHVPSTAKDNGLGPHNERNSFYAAWHEAMGDGAFAVFQVWSHLFVGWPLYLAGLASTGKLAHEGWWLEERNAIADHFRPSSPMFPAKIRAKIALSSATELAVLAGLLYVGTQVGHLPVLLWYWGPYTFVNAWLVLYTWLQHTDPSIPHYGEGEWTWVKGALSTIDRDYGIFDFFHHTIGSTHVVHHLFHEMPWYNAGIATQKVKEFLEPQGLYNYDPTPWYKAMWRIARTCHYVESNEGVQYFKSMENVPLTKDVRNKAA